jgi:ribosome recycling factor
MEDEAILCIEEVKESMQDAMKHLDKEFLKVRAGKHHLRCYLELWWSITEH